jgi:hypothetical protein
MNCGFAVIEGDTTFFINANDGNRIYQILKGETNALRISTDYARCLNFAGDFLYYFKYKADSDGIIDYSICRILSGGSKPEIVVKAGTR